MSGHSVVAAEATGSSKPPRRDPATGSLQTPPNEDRAVAVQASSLFGVFDGHGGFGAAEFVSAHLPPLFSLKLGEARSAAGAGAARADDTVVVPAVLNDTFVSTDQALYATVRSQLPRSSPRVSAGSPRCSTCRWYRERPCACTGVALPANEGSTGSLLHVRAPVRPPTPLAAHPCSSCLLSGFAAAQVTEEYIFSASIGDSEALLISEAAPGEQVVLDEAALPAVPSRSRSVSRNPSGADRPAASLSHGGGGGGGAAASEEAASEEAASGVPICAVCKHRHFPGAACSVCGHVGKRPAAAVGSAVLDVAAEPCEPQEGASKQTAVDQGDSIRPTKRLRVEEPAAAAAAPAVAAAGAAEPLRSTSAPAPMAAAAVAAAAAPALRGPQLTARMLTPCDTPTTNIECEDYQRIKRVAEARTRTRSSNGSERYPDGVQRNSRGLERLNYVALNGAHRLNMTRAFGNFGHKEWRGTAAVESASPVIARPHLATHRRTGREQFVVIGSDGLWDNLSHGAVSAILRKHGKSQAPHTPQIDSQGWF